MFLIHLLFLSLIAPAAAHTETCAINILAPKAEETVEAQGDVVVRAKIPNDTSLWALARREDQPKSFFWPQSAFAASEVNRGEELSFPVHYGVPSDTNHHFKVVIIAVDSNTNARLEKWREQAPSKGYAPIVGLPAVASGCKPAELIVKKVE